MHEGTDTHFGNYLPTHFHGTLFLSLYESLYPFEMSETLPNAILFSSSIVHLGGNIFCTLFDVLLATGPGPGTKKKLNH